MMIDRLGGISPLENIQKTQKVESKATVNAQSDSISISDEAREMAEVYYMSEVAKETPDVRTDLVNQVKEKIKDPNYLNSLAIENTANKILESFGI